MELFLTRIGNSQGVIIPKTLITQFGFKEKIHVDLMNGGIFLTPATVTPPKNPREGWAESIDAAIAKYGQDDEEFWPDDMQDDFDHEWVWEDSEIKS
jgi:antitoxin MazE